MHYFMEQQDIQEKMLRKLMSMKPHKWGNSHTEEKNLVKGLPGHLRGTKLVEKFELLHFFDIAEDTSFYTNCCVFRI